MRQSILNASIQQRAMMTVPLIVLLIVIGCSRRTPTEVSVPTLNLKRFPHFVYAKIVDPVLPVERGTKYEDPLLESLDAKKLGEVTGGGSQLGKDNKIEWVGIDLQLADLDGALDFVRLRLRELGAPAGSVLEFVRDGKNVTLPIH